MAAYGNARGLAQAVGQYAISNFLQHAYDDEAETARQLETLSAILYQEVVAFSAVAHASAPLGAARTSAA
jgi:hypothetical protein